VHGGRKTGEVMIRSRLCSVRRRPRFLDGEDAGFGVSAGLAVATAGPRRERSGKARTAGENGPRAARRAAFKDAWKVLTDPTSA
jgi:hypothetical protein